MALPPLKMMNKFKTSILLPFKQLGHGNFQCAYENHKVVLPHYKRHLSPSSHQVKITLLERKIRVNERDE